MKARGLDAKQAAHFREKGYVALRGCFTSAAAAPFLAAAYKELGCDPEDPKTWTQEKSCLPGGKNVHVSAFAPKAWEAICALVGGEERVLGGAVMQTWSSSFIVKFPRPGAEKETHRHRGWHKDGVEHEHYLDSAEMGLVTYVLWSDLKKDGGGTWLALDSVPKIARHLAAHPEGVVMRAFDTRDMIDSCADFLQLTGKTGDVFLVHPYMLHAESRNLGGPPRFFTARMVELKEPMRFDRPPGRSSIVESAVLDALGVKSLDFKRA